MKPISVWYKQGVHVNLIPRAANGLRKMAKLYGKEGKDLFITSGNDGSHRMDSYHFINRAWDQRQNGVSVVKMRAALGKGFDVVKESNHIHVEYDPK